MFFQTEDAKKNLIEYYDKLDTVVFHKKLGTIRDKAERVAALAKELAPKVGADAEKAEQAAKLSKCDLVTQTVIEATSLQGQIGRLMYEREGGDASMATAIEEHYKPQGPSDTVPTDPVAIAVALADKLDTLVGFWAIDEKPTGSKDPFALRRAALGVVRIILENDVRLPLLSNMYFHRWCTDLRLNISDANKLSKALKFIDGDKNAVNWSGVAIDDFDENVWVCEEIQEYLKTDYQGVSKVADDFFDSCKNLLAFILDRLKVYLRDKGIRHDIIDAGLTEGQDDLVSIVNRVTALQSFLETPDGENLLAGYKRAANILKAEGKKGDLPSGEANRPKDCLLYTSPSPRDQRGYRMPSSA